MEIIFPREKRTPTALIATGLVIGIKTELKTIPPLAPFVLSYGVFEKKWRATSSGLTTFKMAGHFFETHHAIDRSL